MRSHIFRLVPFASAVTRVDINAPALAIEITGTVAFATDEADAVQVIYHISGATERVRYTGAKEQPSRQNELWRSTCFEVFMKSPSRAEYWEYNLAPSGDWNVYFFTDYRSALQAEPKITAIKIATEVEQGCLISLRATLPLPAALRGQQLAIGISSVMEDTVGNVHYFALRHGGDKPDFHDPVGFTEFFAVLPRPPGEGRGEGVGEGERT